MSHPSTERQIRDKVKLVFDDATDFNCLYTKSKLERRHKPIDWIAAKITHTHRPTKAR
jgi:hypothetical protein